MTILVVAEHDNASLKNSTLHTLECARRIGGEVSLLVAGSGCEAVAREAARIAGVARVYLCDAPELAHQLPEVLARTLEALVRAKGFGHVLFATGTVGKAAMPRLAGLLDRPAITDVCAVIAPDTFKRYIYAGGVLATVKTTADVVLATVRPTAFEAVPAEGGDAQIETVAAQTGVRGFDFVSVEEVKSDRPDLLTARRVCAGGRGLFDEAGFAALQELADKMGAAVGSTRAVVDMGLAANETQVGQTGKIVAPELYFAFGISGAIQHVAGMKDSKVIVAVNKDPEAPIFEMCDYYLEADAVEVIKELTAKL